MTLSCIIQVLLEITFVSVIHGDFVVVPQNTAAKSGTDVTIECIVSTIGPTYTWYHGDVPLFGMDFQGTIEREPGTEDEYEDFSVVASPVENFSLIISSVKVEYEGTYVCQREGVGGSAHSAELKVEAEVTSVSITCQSPCKVEGGTISVEEMTECQCTCSAFAGYPRDLVLMWSDGTQGVQTDNSSANGPNGTYDFYRTVAFTTMQNHQPLKCEVVGYTIETIIDSENIKKEVDFDILFSPKCEVTTSGEDKCNDVEVICNCTSNPPVDQFSFYKDGKLVSNDTTSAVIEETFTENVEVTFTCTGYNTINGMEKEGESPVFVYKDCKSTTTIPTTDTPTVTTLIDITSTESTKSDDDATTPNPTKAEATIPTEVPDNNFGLIIGLSVGVPLGLILIAVLVYWFFIKKREDGKGNNDNTDGNGANAKLAPEQPEYAAVNKPKSQPQAAPRPRSQPPDNNEQMELQYADLDHGNRGRTNEIHQPADEPTQYAEVKSVIV